MRCISRSADTAFLLRDEDGEELLKQQKLVVVGLNNLDNDLLVAVMRNPWPSHEVEFVEQAI